MSLFTGIAIFFTIWWTVLFAILPLGVVSHAEAGIDRGDGTDPASPVDPKLKKKFTTTTLIAVALWVILFLVLHFKLISLPPIPSDG